MQQTGLTDKKIGRYFVRNSCQICKSDRLRPFLELGHFPLAGGFLKKEEIQNEVLYPLTVCFCEQCKEVQIKEIVPPDVLFRDYRYTSSTTSTLSKHFVQYAQEMKDRFLEADSFVVEFGSNDGVLLKPFKDLGVRALGIEPATNIARLASAKGCEVINEFFNVQVARSVAENHGKADLICANNIFAHIDDIHEPMRAIELLLKPEGLFVFEVHYLLDLLKGYQYDMIYHEHIMHHSLGALSTLMNLSGMEIFDVKRVSTHSGSLRVYSQKKGSGAHSVTQSVNDLLSVEEAEGCYDFNTFSHFGKAVYERRDQLVQLIRNLTAQGKRVIGYGASGRATVHLNFCQLRSADIEYVVDASHERVGRFIPGVHIPIVGAERLKNDFPDYAVLFAYNYAEEIMKKEKDFLARGGKFIIPVPHCHIVE